MRGKPEVDEKSEWWWYFFFLFFIVLDNIRMEESNICKDDVMNNYFYKIWINAFPGGKNILQTMRTLTTLLDIPKMYDLREKITPGKAELPLSLDSSLHLSLTFVFSP